MPDCKAKEQEVAREVREHLIVSVARNEWPNKMVKATLIKHQEATLI